MGDLTVDAAQREVHLGEPPGRVVRLLSVDADVAQPASVRRDELLGLHEHAGRAAAGVVDTALVRLDHLDQQLDHAARRVELAALLPFGAGELREEVLVYAAQDVLRATLPVADADVGDHVDELAETYLVQTGTGVIARQHALQ